MDALSHFFTTWGLGKFGPEIEAGSFGPHSDLARFTVKNCSEYLPGIGAVVGIYITRDVIEDYADIPAWLSTVAKVGMVVHSLLGILGIGLVCLPFDILASMIRFFHKNQRVPVPLPVVAETNDNDID
jgi:hypothetical protein